MNETSIASARASVMIYDDINKKWVPSGGTSGLSKVHIFQHNYNASFRVVGRKLHDHEVVINCIILPSVKYNQATETFHQWRDNKQIYGLNFSSKTDADAFAKAMSFAVEVLATNGKQNTAIPPMQNNNLLVANSVMSNNNGVVGLANNQPMQQPNGQYEEDMGYRTMTKEDMAVLQERRTSQQQQQQTQLPAVATTAMLGSPNNNALANNSTLAVSPPQQPTSSAGHQRTLSAPPAPQPPPMALCTASIAMSSAPPAPAPPCPPPLPNTLPKTGTSVESDQCSLAAQLQSARLRRSNRQSAENSGSSTTSSSSGGSSNYSTLGRNQNGMASMMDEMAKTLARRRAAVERKECSENIPDEQTLDRKNCVNSSKISLNGCESPKPTQKTFATSSEELILKINGESNSLPIDLENLKQEILQEMKKEINNMKQDIIEFMRQELNKR